MSSIFGAKAISLVQRGGIEEKPHARVFEALGSSGEMHVVVIGAGEPRSRCSCRAGQRGIDCYHARAARLLMAKEREEARRAHG